MPSDVVTAAIRVAEQGRRDVADVPLETIAEAAGMSRSTLLRRLGGSRGPLDDAVRAAGVDLLGIGGSAVEDGPQVGGCAKPRYLKSRSYVPGSTTEESEVVTQVAAGGNNAELKLALLTYPWVDRAGLAPVVRAGWFRFSFFPR